MIKPFLYRRIYEGRLRYNASKCVYGFSRRAITSKRSKGNNLPGRPINF